MKFRFTTYPVFLLLCCIVQFDLLPAVHQPLPYYRHRSIESNNNGLLPSIGPFEISNADSTSTIRFQFAGQLWFLYENRNNYPDDDRTRELTMKARRIRLTLQGTAVRQNLTYKLHLSLSPKSLELMDVYFNHRTLRNIQFRFGQYKTPFTRYRIQSFKDLTFVDWAIVTKYFGSERQMGFSVHNGYERPERWGYVLGVFTGVNARASHALGISEIYGEEPANPSDLSNPGPAGRFHPEIFIHLAHNAKNIQIQSDTDAKRAGFRYSIGLSAAWDIDPVDYTDFHIRLAAEILAKYKGASIFLCDYAGFAEAGNPPQTELAASGGLFQAAYRVNKRYEISARYAIVDFKDAVINDSFDRAQRLIAEARTDLYNSDEKELAGQQLDEVIAQYELAGRISREEEIGFGLNIYMAGNSIKWQSDVCRLRHTFRDKMRSDYLARSQFQLVF